MVQKPLQEVIVKNQRYGTYQWVSRVIRRSREEESSENMPLAVLYVFRLVSENAPGEENGDHTSIEMSGGEPVTVLRGRQMMRLLMVMRFFVVDRDGSLWLLLLLLVLMLMLHHDGQAWAVSIERLP